VSKAINADSLMSSKVIENVSCQWSVVSGPFRS
jgi:hypothetical protein